MPPTPLLRLGPRVAYGDHRCRNLGVAGDARRPLGPGPARRNRCILARSLSVFRVRIASLSPTRGVSRTLTTRFNNAKGTARSRLKQYSKRPCGRRHGPVRRDQPALSRVRLRCRHARRTNRSRRWLADDADSRSAVRGARGAVLMTCVIDDHGAVVSTTPIGSLDPKQKMTFEIVYQHGETDAGELMRKNDDGLKHTTAWNNRLSSLASMGLIME